MTCLQEHLTNTATAVGIKEKLSWKKYKENWQYFLKNRFGWECLNVLQMESYLCVRLRLRQNQRIMKFMILFCKITMAYDLVRLWQLM